MNSEAKTPLELLQAAIAQQKLSRAFNNVAIALTAEAALLLAQNPAQQTARAIDGAGFSLHPEAAVLLEQVDSTFRALEEKASGKLQAFLDANSPLAA